VVKHPKVFVSYSWEDESHQSWVRSLATRLKQDGVDVTLDQWHLKLGDQLPRFMETAVRDNDFVLIVCTPKYRERSNDRSSGVGYEGDIMTAEVQTSQNHRKFVPVLKGANWKESAPSWILGKRYVDMRKSNYHDKTYFELLEHLTGVTYVPNKNNRTPSSNLVLRLVEKLKSGTEAQRIAACDALADGQEEARCALPLLCQKLNDKSNLVSRAAMKAISAIRLPQNLVPRLVCTVRYGWSVPKSHAISLLGEFDQIGDESIPEIVKLLDGDDQYFRFDGRYDGPGTSLQNLAESVIVESFKKLAVPHLVETLETNFTERIALMLIRILDDSDWHTEIGKQILELFDQALADSEFGERAKVKLVKGLASIGSFASPVLSRIDGLEKIVIEAASRFYCLKATTMISPREPERIRKLERWLYGEFLDGRLLDIQLNSVHEQLQAEDILAFLKTRQLPQNVCKAVVEAHENLPMGHWSGHATFQINNYLKSLRELAVNSDS